MSFMHLEIHQVQSHDIDNANPCRLENMTFQKALSFISMRMEWVGVIQSGKIPWSSIRTGFSTTLVATLTWRVHIPNSCHLGLAEGFVLALIWPLPLSTQLWLEWFTALIGHQHTNMVPPQLTWGKGLVPWLPSYFPLRHLQPPDCQPTYTKQCTFWGKIWNTHGCPCQLFTLWGSYNGSQLNKNWKLGVSVMHWVNMAWDWTGVAHGPPMGGMEFLE